MLLAGDQQRSSCAEHYRRIKIIRSRSVSPGQPQRIRSRVHDAQSPANERTSTVSPPVYPATTDTDPLSGGVLKQLTGPRLKRPTPVSCRPHCCPLEVSSRPSPPFRRQAALWARSPFWAFRRPSLQSSP